MIIICVQPSTRHTRLKISTPNIKTSLSFSSCMSSKRPRREGAALQHMVQRAPACTNGPTHAGHSLMVQPLVGLHWNATTWPSSWHMWQRPSTSPAPAAGSIVWRPSELRLSFRDPRMARVSPPTRDMQKHLCPRQLNTAFIFRKQTPAPCFAYVT